MLGEGRRLPFPSGSVCLTLHTGTLGQEATVCHVVLAGADRQEQCTALVVRAAEAQLLPAPVPGGAHFSLPRVLLGFTRREKMRHLIPRVNESGTSASLWSPSHAHHFVATTDT